MRKQPASSYSRFACFTVLAIAGCKTSAPKPETAHDAAIRQPAARAEPAIPFATTPFGKLTVEMRKHAYFANLHAHHFMDVHGSKKNPLSLEEALQPGACRASKGTFPMDDGRPCRDEKGERNVTILPRAKLADGSPDVTDYFRQACEYGTSEGALDILFVTPHTKNNGQNEGQIVTSTMEAEMTKRQSMLAEINPDRRGRPKFLCGLGQEASSISAGNHVNIFGQFHAGAQNEKPFYFPTGDFRTLYSAIRAKNAAGGKVFLQMNHPDARADLYWGEFAKFGENKRLKKEGLNDYGLDDYAPVGCLTGKLPAESPECAGGSAERLTPELLRQTFRNIRAASGDPFRLIEVIPPGAAKEGGDDTDGDGTPDTAGEEAFGATTNTRTTFRRVHHRTSTDTYEEGVYDWVFYLSMGFKLGPTANQDNHHMNFGSATASRTGVIAANLREATVLDALEKRRVFASEDQNARVLLAQVAGKTRRIMGDSAVTSATRTRIQIAYYDPDGSESTAKVRLYYYRAGDALDFGYRAPAKLAYRTVAFGPKNEITLPAPDAQDRSERDLIPIQNGQVLNLNLPLTKGVQWVFAEIIQDHDFDKIWTAPIWIDRR